MSCPQNKACISMRKEETAVDGSVPVPWKGKHTNTPHTPPGTNEAWGDHGNIYQQSQRACPGPQAHRVSLCTVNTRTPGSPRWLWLLQDLLVSIARGCVIFAEVSASSLVKPTAKLWRFAGDLSSHAYLSESEVGIGQRSHSVWALLPQ